MRLRAHVHPQRGVHRQGACTCIDQMSEMSERQRVFHRARSMRYRNRNMAIGRCKDCPRPVVGRGKRCSAHVEKDRARSLALRTLRKATGICPRCARKLHAQMDEGCFYCLPCREIHPAEQRANAVHRINYSIGDNKCS